MSDRSQRLLTEHIESLRLAYASVRKRHPFQTDAIVTLPDHLHCLWTLPEGDADYPTRRRSIKTRFTASLAASGIRANRRCHERAVWQPRFWEHAIRDEMDLSRHIDYIHFNPVKHGLTDRVSDWPHSSFHRFCRDGNLLKDWAGVFESHHKKGE
ncbi:transposase [Luteimonas sp. SX5]|uniref:Transposase n=1 Tax=Luteimonas galliterrae TaxID=2940486 RepID=A0ABT0MK05_9GAMM|nr:transposase [Luteimonas galliterrae]MCL1635196.1 transposase [Luteimonas galliterrae]